MIKLLAVFAFMLLRNRKRSPNEANHLKCACLKSQQSEKSSNKQKYKWIASLRNISYCRKNVTFLIESTFTLASSVQEVPVIFK